MASNSLSQQKTQLDKGECEHLESVVEDMREHVEENVEFQLTQKGLDEELMHPDERDDETQDLVEATS